MEEEDKKTEGKKPSIIISPTHEDFNFVKYPREGEKNFLGLFEYEYISEGSEENKRSCAFENCTILKDFTKYKKGDKVKAIWFGLDLFFHKENEMDQDEQILYFL